MISPQVLFLACLLSTVVLLAAVVTTGLRGHVKSHLALVSVTLLALAATIYFAEKLGTYYDIRAAGAITPVHLSIAKLATVAYLAPTISGLMTLRNRRHKRLHFKLAMLTLALTVAAAMTGTWMVLAAPELAAQP